VRRETGVGLAVTAGAILVVAVAGLVTPGSHHANASGGSPATNADGAPIAARAPYDCRPDDTPHLTALGGHQHAQGFDEAAIAVLPAATCAELQRQLAVTARAARIAPTLGDAERLGYKMVGFYSPGLGIHMERPRQIDTKFDPAEPAYMLYGGNLPSAPIVGFAFSVVDPNGVPSMFAGGHDVPHSHGFCPGAKGQPALSPGQGTCTRANAIGGNEWLVHVWAVPGKPSAWGVFADANPALTPHGYDTEHLMSANTLDCFYDTKAYTAPYKGCSLKPA
jgi:hypothetical protein